MATTSPEPKESTWSEPVAASPASSPMAVPPQRSSKWPVFVVALGALVIIGGLVAAAAGPKIRAWFGEDDVDLLKVYPVKRQNLLVSVLEDGNLESAANVDIKSQVEGVTTILKIVEDGSMVKKGDVLVELDSSALEEQITQQQIAVNRAEATMVQAEKDLQVAIISKQEYEEGTFRQQLQDAEAQITIALENLRTAENTLAHTQRMFRKGYVSKLQLESQQFAVKTAELNLKSAETAKDVLTKYTKAKMLEDLQAQIDAARTRASSEKEAYELEVSKLKRLQQQLENCTIVAPQDGMVVYANDPGRRGSEGVTIEEGASVRERQTILRLPDLSKMQVKVNVHESKVEDLSPGLPATIKVQDRVFDGEVASIASQPEPTSWWSGNIKEYATIVKILGEPASLKPGMTAEVEIKVKELENVLVLPVSAVVESRGKFYCWLQTPSGPKRRELKLGATNDKFVEVQDGVSEGEIVIRNPLASVPEAQESESEDAESGRQSFGAKGGSKKGGKGGPAGPKGARPGGAGKKSGRSFDLKQFDKDGDGAISKEEAPGMLKANFDRVDTNGDGKLDAAEQEAMRRAFSSGGGAKGAGGRSGGGLSSMDKNGDGKITKDELPERMQPFFDRMDTNGDGVIDEAEIQAARSRAKSRS